MFPISEKETRRSNSSMDGFMRVLNYNPLDGGELNRYVLKNIGRDKGRRFF